jgi:hypothetical protein
MKRKHKMKKKQQRMKTLQFKRKRKKIKTTEVNMQTNMFRLLELRSRLFNKFSKREISGLKLKVMVVPCHKCFLTDKSATEGAGSHTTILRGEGARAHLKCLLANWWLI